MIPFGARISIGDGAIPRNQVWSIRALYPGELPAFDSSENRMQSRWRYSRILDFSTTTDAQIHQRTWLRVRDLACALSLDSNMAFNIDSLIDSLHPARNPLSSVWDGVVLFRDLNFWRPFVARGPSLSPRGTLDGAPLPISLFRDRIPIRITGVVPPREGRRQILIFGFFRSDALPASQPIRVSVNRLNSTVSIQATEVRMINSHFCIATIQGELEAGSYSVQLSVGSTTVAQDDSGPLFATLENAFVVT